MNNLDDLERFVASIPSAGDPVIIPPELLTPANINGPVFQSVRGDGAPEEGEIELEPVLELISVDAFSQQWALVHDMMGGIVQSRTGYPCALGDQARSEGGRVACNAAYSLISQNPALARMILSQESTFFGQLAAIGVHGFTCVQLVKASQAGLTGEAERQAA